MFNIGPGELVVIGVLALLLLGPDKLPELARGLGKALREFRKHTDDVRGMVEREFYKMDQDVLQDASKKEPPSVSAVSASRFGTASTETAEAEPRILPAPSVPAFPSPEGVVPSRPPLPDAAPSQPPPPATAESTSADVARSDQHSDGVPRRDA
jgi:sec-independent protein translocase protein TatB